MGLLFPSLLLGGVTWSPSLSGVALFPLSFCVVSPSFSPFWWGSFLSPLLLGGVVWPPSLSGVALFPLLLRGVASFLGWGSFLSPLLLGGAALPPPLGGAAFFLSFFVVLPSFPSFLECLLLFGGASFLLLLLWFGLVSSPSSAGRCCLTFSFFGWCRLASSLGWCCVTPSLFAWCCLPSPPSLADLFQKEKSKNRKKNEVRNKK